MFTRISKEPAIKNKRPKSVRVQSSKTPADIASQAPAQPSTEQQLTVNDARVDIAETTGKNSAQAQPSKSSQSVSEEVSKTPDEQPRRLKREGSFSIDAAGSDYTRPRAEEGAKNPHNLQNPDVQDERKNPVLASEQPPQAADENTVKPTKAKILEQFHKNRRLAFEQRSQMPAESTVKSPGARIVEQIREKYRHASEQRSQVAAESRGARALKRNRNKPEPVKHVPVKHVPERSEKPQGLGERSKTFVVPLTGHDNKRPRAEDGPMNKHLTAHNTPERTNPVSVRERRPKIVTGKTDEPAKQKVFTGNDLPVRKSKPVKRFPGMLT